MVHKDKDESTISFGIEDTESSDASPFSFIPLAIGLAGVLLGGVAIYLSYSGSGKAGAAQDASEQMGVRLQARLESMEERFARIDNRLEHHAAEGDALERTLRNMASQTQNVLTQLSNELNRTKEQISTQSRQMQELAEALNETRAATGRRSAPAAAAEGREEGRSPAAESAATDVREHRIQSGDTFSTLALRYGVSVDAILEANPNANPRRLQIGEVIRIPAQPGN